MAIPIRYVLVVVFLIVSTFKLSESDITSAYPTIQAVLFVTSRIHDLPSLGTLVSPQSSASGSPLALDFTPHFTQLNSSERANATFVILCRNSDLDGIIQSVRSVEDRFNHRYGYPYVFLNEEPFDDNFKRYASSR